MTKHWVIDQLIASKDIRVLWPFFKGYILDFSELDRNLNILFTEAITNEAKERNDSIIKDKPKNYKSNTPKHKNIQKDSIKLGAKYIHTKLDNICSITKDTLGSMWPNTH